MARGIAAVLNRSRRLGGFTVLEILVAVTLTAMLAALVGAVALRAQARARTQACADNLHRLGQAMRLYARDYDDRPAPAAIAWKRYVPGRTWYRETAYWPALLRPYLTSDDALWCPDALHHGPEVVGPGMEWKTYAANAHVTGKAVEGSDIPVRPLSAVVRPERVGLFADSAGVCFLRVEEFIAEPYEPLRIGMHSPWRTTYLAHDGGINVGYVDGHVGWLARGDFVGDHAAGSRLWGNPHTAAP